MSTLRTTVVFLLAALSAVIVCSDCFPSTSFSAGVQVGTIANSSITEASGIAASRRNSNVLWTHNDSGDTERVFAMTPAGTHLGTYTISGNQGADWEDIAVGPGPAAGTQYLYIGAIGDNNANRADIHVYRAPEPVVSDTQSPVTAALSGVSKLTFAYPDGPRDAESLFVDPLTRDIYILTKRENPHRLYRAAYPQATSGTTMLEFVTEYSISYWLTAADISPDGDEILVRGSEMASGRMFVRPPGGTIKQALESAPITIPLAFALQQGEAIGFDPLGWGYYTVTEGINRPIYYFNRLPAPGDFNQDGIIDAADYVAMRKTDDTQDAYNMWLANFGEGPGGAASAVSAPEPLSVWIIVMGMLPIVRRRSWRAKSTYPLQ
jgi:hypothetical protein